jgi:hypothetical protein
MRKLLAALFGAGLLALLGASSALAQATTGPSNLPLCNKIATFSGVAVATRLVSGVVGQTIIICGWHVTTSSGTAVTFSITFGTKTTNECDTNTVTVVPTLNITSAAPSSDHISSATTSITGATNLCITPSSATESGVVYYGQF